jgi:hypothetical protein
MHALGAALSSVTPVLGHMHATVAAQYIRSRKEAPLSVPSLCWKTLQPMSPFDPSAPGPAPYLAQNHDTIQHAPSGSLKATGRSHSSTFCIHK